VVTPKGGGKTSAWEGGTGRTNGQDVKPCTTTCNINIMYCIAGAQAPLLDAC